MRDIWGFLLQTLTVSSVGAVLLLVKAMFRDKLTPRWQLSVWSVFLAAAVLPAGWGGRYAVFNAPLLVEGLKTLLAGEYTLTRILAPVPLPALSLPRTGAEWAFAVYALGVLCLLGWYIFAYLRLRLALKRGGKTDLEARIREIAERNGLAVCEAVEVEGVESCFVCGFFHPVLVIPQGEVPEEKVLLHELEHLKHKDALWGAAACLVRCLHWCNPLAWYCARCMANDVESACDQRVLERLEGEERREYGRILLSMASEKYACVPGTSSMANGGKNIRRRIEVIARFKRYPQGMGLVSVCLTVLLGAALIGGTAAGAVYQGEIEAFAMASARTTRCTTPAGALDAYGKALLSARPLYRALCAPVEEHEELAKLEKWDGGLPAAVDASYGYTVFDMLPRGRDYTCRMALILQDDGKRHEGAWFVLIWQELLLTREEGRWTVLPQGGFQKAETDSPHLYWGSDELPSVVYAAETENVRVERLLQTSYAVESAASQNHGSVFVNKGEDLVPLPHANFETTYRNEELRLVYTGTEEEGENIRFAALTTAPLLADGSWPDLEPPRNINPRANSGSWGSMGYAEGAGAWNVKETPVKTISGGGIGEEFDRDTWELPQGYACRLYINHAHAADLTLRMEEGGAP